MIIIRGLFIISTCLLSTPSLWAYGLFPVGSENRERAIESPLSARSGSAVFYNPAALNVLPNLRPYADVAFIDAQYSYEHPQFDPVRIHTTSPFATLSLTGPVTRKISLGATLLPSERSDLAINGLPRVVAGQTEPIKVNSAATAFNTGFGVGYQALRSTSIGLSLIHTYENRKLRAADLETDNTLLEYDATSQSLRPVAGVLSKVGLFQVGFGYRHEQKKDYNGDYFSAANPNATDPQLKGYEPAVYSLGLGVDVTSRISFQLDQNYRTYSRGKKVFKSGQGNDPAEADLNDTWERGISGSFAMKKFWHLTAGYSILPTPWGNGHRQSEDPALAEGDPVDPTSGVDFGQLNGVDRHAFGIGSRFFVTPRQKLDLSYYASNGSRTTSDDAHTPGRYQLNLHIIGLTFMQRI